METTIVLKDSTGVGILTVQGHSSEEVSNAIDKIREQNPNCSNFTIAKELINLFTGCTVLLNENTFLYEVN